MNSVSRPIFRSIALLVVFLFSFTFIFADVANAATAGSQQTVQKQKLIADIGGLPDKLPKTKLELTDKRTEYSTRFLNPDGSFTEEIYSQVKFYQDPSDKKWKEIDNNLKADTAGKFGNGAGGLDVDFAKQSDTGDLVSVSKDGKSISLAPVKGNSVTGSVNKNEITYSNLFAGTDVRYYVNGDSVKEDIVLKSYNNQNTFSYEVKMNGVKASTDNTGTIIFTDNKGKKLWYFEDPFMTDANGKYSNKVTLALKTENGKTYVDVTADNTFLQDPDTKYPVTIDPTIDSWNVIRDTFISASYPNTSYSSDSYFHTGLAPSYGAARSLVQFALPALPSDSKITSANFNAYQTKVDASNVSIDLYRTTSAWSGATATWNNQPAINSTAEATTTSNASNAYWQWDITQLAKDWYNSVQPNYGFMLKQQNEGTSPYRSFKSVNSGSNTPRLTINYTVDPIGVEDFWSYTKDNVNPANGNLVLQQSDLSIPGRGVPVSISRTYNSRKTYVAGMFGYGWRSNVEAQLVDAGSGPITLIDADGTRNIFGENVTGGYYAGGGIYLALVKNGDGTYTITQTDGTVINFNTGGKISSIVDLNGNATSYTYTSGKLTTIADASGRTTTIAYGTNGYVSSITYNPANQTIAYGYDGNGNLTTVTDPAGKVITFGNFDTDHNMGTIKDQRNITTTIGYDTANDRVTSISRPITIDGVQQTSTTNYSYDTYNLVTAVTDGEGNRIDYTYNANGNVVQVTQNPLDAANKAITYYAYDSNNNLTQIKDPNTNKAGGPETYIYTYDSNGNVTGVQLPLGQNENYVYDSQNNMISSTDFIGNTSTYDYDGDGNNIEATDPNIQTNANRYFPNGNLNYSTAQMSAADNIVADSSFETDADSNNWPDNWTSLTQSGTTASFAWSGTAKFGNKTVSISNPTGWAVVTSDMVPYTAGSNYVVSGYVKTAATAGTAYVKVDFYNASGTWLSQQNSYSLAGTQDWTRIQAVVDDAPAGTTQVKVSVGLNAGTGTVYFDGIQLEKGTVLSAYNLVDNSSFERDANSDNQPDNWTRAGLTASDVKDSAENHGGIYSYKITGQSSTNKYVKQRINISGAAGTLLTLSGWSKQSGANPGGGNYLMQVSLNDSNGNPLEWHGNDFDKSAEDWQQVASEIKAENAFSSIDVYYQYQNQTGIAWFDAMRLEIGNQVTRNTYDANENYVTSVKDTLGNTVTYTNDTFGNVTSIKDPKNQTTSFRYNTRNLLDQVTDAKNGITAYAYDNAGNMTNVTDARNKVTNYSYNEYNQVSSITNALNQTIQFGYNKNGASTKVIFPKGDSITSTYNALNRLSGVYYNGIQKFGYTYDANGNVTSINNIAAGKTTDYTYDKNDRITRMSEGANNRFDYVYDNNSNLATLTYTAGAASSAFGYTYDSLNQVTALSRNTSNLVKFIYDERGSVISARYGNGTYTAYEYDTNGRLTSVKNYNAAGTVPDSFVYTYDANGNRTSVTSAGGTISYQYDELNRLTRETLLDGTTIDYEYDAVGNRTKKTVTNGGSTVTNYTYDNANELTAVNGQAYTYDSNGNLTGNGAKTFIYNEVNQLIEVKNSGGSTIATYTYDDAGKRISMTAASGNTTYYYYSGDKVIYETDGNTVIAEYAWDAAGNPVTMTRGGATYYYQLDGHGSVTKLTDASGNAVAQYQYDAWGNILSQSGTMASINPYRYAGYRYDEATGLYYLMARYYDANVGRFLTRDTVQAINLYAYSGNNPANFYDPSGNVTQADIDAYKSGKIKKWQWDAINLITNYWNKAKTSGDKYFYHAAAEEFRKNGYKAAMSVKEGGNLLVFKYWWGEKSYISASLSSKKAYALTKEISAATKVSIGGGVITFLAEKNPFGFVATTSLVLSIASSQDVVDDLSYGSSTGRGTVITRKYYTLFNSGISSNPL